MFPIAGRVWGSTYRTQLGSLLCTPYTGRAAGPALSQAGQRQLVAWRGTQLLGQPGWWGEQ